MAEKKYKVSLEKLRKKLNELTGGPSTDFTGTLCEVVPLNKFTVLVSSNEKLKELMESGEIHKNCVFYFDIILKREDIVPYGFERHDERDCRFEFCFNLVALNSNHKLADGTHLYDYIEIFDYKPGSLSSGINPLSSDFRAEGKKFVRFKAIPANLLTITLKQEDIDAQDEWDRDLIEEAVLSVNENAFEKRDDFSK